MLGTPCYPASEDVLVLYVADLSQKVCHSTIRSYLSAIRHAHLEQGFQDPMAGKTRLELALFGITPNQKRRMPRTKHEGKDRQKEHSSPPIYITYFSHFSSISGIKFTKRLCFSYIFFQPATLPLSSTQSSFLYLAPHGQLSSLAPHRQLSSQASHSQYSSFALYSQSPV